MNLHNCISFRTGCNSFLWIRPWIGAHSLQTLLPPGSYNLFFTEYYPTPATQSIIPKSDIEAFFGIFGSTQSNFPTQTSYINRATSLAMMCFDKLLAFPSPLHLLLCESFIQRMFFHFQHFPIPSPSFANFSMMKLCLINLWFDSEEIKQNRLVFLIQACQILLIQYLATPPQPKPPVFHSSFTFPSPSLFQHIPSSSVIPQPILSTNSAISSIITSHRLNTVFFVLSPHQRAVTTKRSTTTTSPLRFLGV